MCLAGRETSDLLCMPLTQAELDCVSSYLGDKGSLDKLVIHHLQMGNLAEAVELNKALNSQPLVRLPLSLAARRDVLCSFVFCFLSR